MYQPTNIPCKSDKWQVLNNRALLRYGSKTAMKRCKIMKIGHKNVVKSQLKSLGVILESFIQNIWYKALRSCVIWMETLYTTSEISKAHKSAVNIKFDIL